MKIDALLTRVRFDFPETGRIIVGLSGGADSVLLTHLLFEKYGAEKLHCAHVHHGIRGAEADRDEQFVRDFCAARQIPLTVFHKDIPALAAQSGEGVEACARRVRYACFESLLSGREDRIATAHNADDNAETLLLNLTRGMGPGGASGIPYRRGRILRPLLKLSRCEIEFLCAAYGLEFVVDSTNLQEIYTRNRLRHSVLPQLREINPQLTEAVSRFTESIALQNDYMRGQAQALLQSAACPYGLSLPVLRGAHEALLLAALELYLSPLGRLSAVHLREASLLVRTGGSWTLPGGVQLTAKQDTLTLSFGTPEAFSRTVCAGETVLPNGKVLHISKKLLKKEKNTQKVHSLLFKNFLDCDKITGALMIRTRRAGDVFSPAGRGVSKPVKKLLNEMRIPAAVRGGLLLLEQNGKIIWIEEIGAAEGFAANEKSTSVLDVSVSTLPCGTVTDNCVLN